MAETIDKHTERTYNTTFTCRFKDNTLVGVSPTPKEFSLERISSDDGAFTEWNKDLAYPLYVRDHQKVNKASTKEVTCYVHQH